MGFTLGGNDVGGFAAELWPFDGVHVLREH